MKKEYRIKKSQEFQEIMQKKRYASLPSMVIYVDHRKEDHCRFGISCSKRMGNAVERNKIKRQIRMLLQEVDFEQYPYDGVLIVRSHFNQQSFADNKKDLEICLKKVKIR